uniref:Uncharacterized protein n=1 Tax=Arcella intermedia TaxID=1963864 RepID=A0A6B2LT02_9EUKA|eukprot:TRINITY_DN12407_c0_g2_i1.p1 TRINITY_DN12407_c0_g2~~TRINITY_DN12407_c0_g2_i1.p1  ORF type:complete len:113 (+),score=34.93 TRINITY_DN12407_c0_g2_i1:123-461(+)
MQNCYKNTDSFILIYSTVDYASYEKIQELKEEIVSIRGNTFPAVLFGNKVDLADQRAVTADQGEQLAAKYSFPFFEGSAKTDIHINDAFAAAVRAAFSVTESKEKKQTCQLM